MERLPFILPTYHRTGSHLLMSLLSSVKPVGDAVEKLLPVFRDNPDPTDDEILEVFDGFYQDSIETAHGVWGLKVTIKQVLVIERWFQLTDLNPEIKWIHLRRHNKLDQALSLLRTTKTNLFHLRSDSSQTAHDMAICEVDISIAELQERLSKCYLADDLWLSFFRRNGITPLELYYEEFQHPPQWNSVVQKVFDFVGIPYEAPIEATTDFVKTGTGDKPAVYYQLLTQFLRQELPIHYIYDDFLEKETRCI